ncbi:MAG: hypothetical protein IPO18_08915 [bacterium]|nr:hypothetical protein [bacterium]
MALYSLLRTGSRRVPGRPATPRRKRIRKRILPGNIYEAIGCHRPSTWVREMLGDVTHTKYCELKKWRRTRCPRPDIGQRHQAVGDRGSITGY